MQNHIRGICLFATWGQIHILIGILAFESLLACVLIILKLSYTYWLFSVTICHPQMDGQTEVVNRTLGTLLWAIIGKNLKKWEESLPFIEFAYNRSVHTTTSSSPFEVVYGFNSLTSLNLFPLPSKDQVNLDGLKKAEFVQNLHKMFKQRIERKNEQYTN